jgi:hypothetical protein
MLFKWLPRAMEWVGFSMAYIPCWIDPHGTLHANHEMFLCRNGEDSRLPLK